MRLNLFLMSKLERVFEMVNIAHKLKYYMDGDLWFSLSLRRISSKYFLLLSLYIEFNRKTNCSL